MFKFFKKLLKKAQRACTRVYDEIVSNVQEACIRVYNEVRCVAQAAGVRVLRFAKNCCGDLATNTIGAIIIAVVIVGLLIVAINAFFPGFFGDMFDAMSDKLNANW